SEENAHSGYIKPSWLLLAVFSSALISSFASAGMVLLLK
ncbi:transcriptional regulator, partial [Vibrio cholerae]